MPTLRFDYHGTGDSSGSDYEPGRVDAWLASVGHAIDEARRLTGAAAVVLIGVRLGSLLAIYTAAQRTDISALVAWAPVASGRARVRELRAFEQLMSGADPMPSELPEGTVAAAGFIFTRESVERLGELEVARLPDRSVPRALVVPRDDLPDDGKFATALENQGVHVTRAPLRGFAAMMRDAHATQVPEEAISGIVEWLRDIRTGIGIDAPPVAPSAEPHLRGIPSGAEMMGLERPPRLDVIEERPFYSDGGRLFGILTEPVGEKRSLPWIVLANAGAVHRIGSNRLYVTAARMLAERGFPVLRLDIGGLGDSPPFPGMAENDTYSSRAVPDIEAATTELRNRCGAARIVVAGLCSGAHTAFHSALVLEGIVGLMMLNPIVFYWKPSDALDVSAWMTYQRVQRYQERALSLDTWVSTLRGKVNVSLAFRTLIQRLRDRLAASGRSVLRELRYRMAIPHTGEDVGQDLARLCSKGIEVALIFSEGDPGLDNLRLNYSGDLRRLSHRPNFVLHEIPWKGHTFTAVPAQRRLLSLLTAHLQQRFS